MGIITDISYMNNQDPDSTIHKRHVFWTETPKWRPLPEHMHYGDFNLIQGLARMESCLELFRTLIRPASLSLRLSANISCGHILAVLSSGPAVPFSLFHILRPVWFVLSNAMFFILFGECMWANSLDFIVLSFSPL